MTASSCIITGKHSFNLVSTDKQRRVLSPAELRIRTHYSLISPGTELAIFCGEHVGLADPQNLFAKYPFTPGYAAVGEVLEVGPLVEGFVRGQFVYFEGAHESVAIVDAVRKNVRPLPEGIDLRLAPFARLAQISSTALLVCQLPESPATIAIVGLGLIGILAAQLLQAAGHRIIGADTIDARREWARSVGIERVVETDGRDLAQRLRAAAAGAEIDICIEATGSAPVVQTALELVRSRGQVVLLGSPRGKAEIDLYNHIHLRGVALTGAHERLLRADPARLRATVDGMLQCIANGKLVIAPLVSKVVQPTDLAEAYRLLHTDRQNTLGVLLDWQSA